MTDVLLPTPEAVRSELEAWIDENWDPDLTVGEWWRRLGEAGYTSPSLPSEWGGRGWSTRLAIAVRSTLSARGVLPPPSGLGTMLAGPTIVAHGTDEQKRRFVAPILDGRDGWCQLFSEPNAGSDLAGLQTRAVRDGDEWVITGQKVWTSMGQFADWGMLLARTDPDLPKHKGITYFAFPMRQAGVDVRPLREMTGRALFNEVFIDEARVSSDCIIGDLNDGWRVANTTLAVERSSIGSGGGEAFSAAIPGSRGDLDKRVGDFVGASGPTAGGGVGPGTVQRLFALAREYGRAGDPVVRQRLAQLWTMVEVNRLSGLRAKAGSGCTGGEGNLAKILLADTVRVARDVASEILGPAGTLADGSAPAGGWVHELVTFSPAPSIYGGSDEVQRNIVGERVLGLPKEPGPDPATPFRALLSN